MAELEAMETGVEPVPTGNGQLLLGNLLLVALKCASHYAGTHASPVAHVSCFFCFFLSIFRMSSPDFSETIHY